MSKIVVSYRRSDAPAMAGRICDHLKARYGTHCVYMDIDNIPIGTDFREHIGGALAQAEIVVAIVGPKWQGLRRSGQPRIMEADDLVRIEIEAALARTIAVVPVLVDDAAMPASANLPESIQGFAFRNGVSIAAGVDFHPHMERLTRALDGLIKHSGQGDKAAPRRWKRLALPVGAAVAATVAVMAFGAYVLGPVLNNSPPASGRGGPAPVVARSFWLVEDSLVHLVAEGALREFRFVTPSRALLASGAQPEGVIFEGRNEDNVRYDGKAYVFAGRCGKFAYDVRGPILNDLRTVDLSGKAPRVDQATCTRTGYDEARLVFNFLERK